MSVTARKCLTFLLAFAWIPLTGVSAEGAGSQPKYSPFYNSAGMDLRLMSPGTFIMGSADEVPEPAREYGVRPFWCNLEWTHPSHPVTLRQPYLIGKSEVTQYQYEKVMGTNPSRPGRGTHTPVDCVSWHDAVEFCRKLTESERASGKLPANMAYRLPTEAEWEYACRAGDEKAEMNKVPSRLMNYAWCYENSSGRPQLATSKTSNPWGLYGVYGNVSEWCSDWYAKDYYKSSPPADPKGPSSGTNRVIRGGGYEFSSKLCLSVLRNSAPPTDRWPGMGFRVVCAAAEPSGPPLTVEAMASSLKLSRIGTYSSTTSPSAIATPYPPGTTSTTPSSSSFRPEGPNVAIGARISTSPPLRDGEDPRAAVDGDPSTEWVRESMSFGYITLDLGKEVAGHSVRIIWGKDYPPRTRVRTGLRSTYLFTASLQNTTTSSSQPRTENYLIPEGRVIRYVQIYMYRSSTSSRFALREIEVYAKGEGTAVASATTPSAVPTKPAVPSPEVSGIAACAALTPEFTSLMTRNKTDDAIKAVDRFISTTRNPAAKAEAAKMKKDALNVQRIDRKMAEELKKVVGKQRIFHTKHGTHTGIIRKVEDGMAYLEIGQGDGAVHAPIKISSMTEKTVTSLLAGGLNDKSADDNLAVGAYLAYVVDDKKAASRYFARAQLAGADISRYKALLEEKDEDTEEAAEPSPPAGMPQTRTELDALIERLDKKRKEETAALIAIETAYKTNDKMEVLSLAKDWADTKFKPFSTILLGDVQLAYDAARHVSDTSTRMLRDASSGTCPDCHGSGKKYSYKTKTVYSGGRPTTVRTPVYTTCKTCHGKGKLSKGRRIGGLTQDQVKKIAVTAETCKRDLSICRSAGAYSSMGTVRDFSQNLKSRAFTQETAKWCWDKGFYGLAAAILRSDPQQMTSGSGGR